MGDSPDNRVIRSYLLGEMTEAERSEFQERIFADDHLFDRVREVEQDLIDALARGEVSGSEADRVRAFLEESSQQHRLAFAGALARQERRPRSPRWHWAAPLAACLLLAPAAGVLALRNHRLEGEIARQTAATPAPAANANSLYVAQLAPSVARGASSPPAIPLPAAARIVELRLGIRAPGAFSRYRVDIQSAGQAVLTVVVPGPLGPELPVAVPRRMLGPGDYELALSGEGTDGSVRPIEYYYFSIP